MKDADRHGGEVKMANVTAENRTGGYADLFLTALCWSFVGLFTRSNACSAWLTSAVASLSGLLFLLVVVRPTLRFTKRAVLVGLANCVMSLTFIFANKLTSVGNAIVLQYSSTIFVIIYESIERHHLPRVSKIGVVVMAFAGMLLFFLDELTAEGMLGNLLSIVSGAFFGLAFFMNAKPGALPMPSSLVGFAVASLGFLVVAPEVPTVSPMNWALMLGQGIVCSGVSSIFYARGIRRVPAFSANMICMSEVILAPTWAFLAFGESFGRFAFMGAMLIVASIVINLVLDCRTTRRDEGPTGHILSCEGCESTR